MNFKGIGTERRVTGQIVCRFNSSQHPIVYSLHGVNARVCDDEQLMAGLVAFD